MCFACAHGHTIEKPINIYYFLYFKLDVHFQKITMFKKVNVHKLIELNDHDMWNEIDVDMWNEVDVGNINKRYVK